MLTQSEYSNLKRRLTVAKKKGSEAVIAEVDRAFGIFDDKGYPDSWHNWEIARYDAETELLRRK